MVTEWVAMFRLISTSSDLLHFGQLMSASPLEQAPLPAVMIDLLARFLEVRSGKAAQRVATSTITVVALKAMWATRDGPRRPAR